MIKRRWTWLLVGLAACIIAAGALVEFGGRLIDGQADLKTDARACAIGGARRPDVVKCFESKGYSLDDDPSGDLIVYGKLPPVLFFRRYELHVEFDRDKRVTGSLVVPFSGPL